MTILRNCNRIFFHSVSYISRKVLECIEYIYIYIYMYIYTHRHTCICVFCVCMYVLAHEPILLSLDKCLLQQYHFSHGMTLKFGEYCIEITIIN